MSLHATRAAWRVKVPSGRDVSGRTAHHVLLALADTCRRGQDTVRVSVSELAALTGYGHRTVRRALVHLRARHLVFVQDGPTPRRSTRYRFGPWFHALPVPEARGVSVAAQGGQRDPLRGVTVAGIPGFRDSPGLDTAPRRTARERKAIAERTAAIRGSVSTSARTSRSTAPGGSSAARPARQSRRAAGVV